MEVRPLVNPSRGKSWTSIPRRDIWLVASHGGHLSELFDMIGYEPERMLLLTYDSTRTRTLPGTLLVENIGRNPWRLLTTFSRAFLALVQGRPKLVISTGAEVAIPVLLAARLLRIATIYVEPCTRVRRPTLTGKLVYPLSTLFLVQSEEMLSHFGPRAIYRGGLV